MLPVDSVLAFSPGFAAPMVTHGRPRVFIAHGDEDRVLPIERCSRPPPLLPEAPPAIPEPSDSATMSLSGVPGTRRSVCT
jgi:hypothetical protein